MKHISVTLFALVFAAHPLAAQSDCVITNDTVAIRCVLTQDQLFRLESLRSDLRGFMSMRKKESSAKGVGGFLSSVVGRAAFKPQPGNTVNETNDGAVAESQMVPVRCSASDEKPEPVCVWRTP